jgi:hypothetical protein
MIAMSERKSMSDQVSISAQILQFPARQPPPTNDPQERLRRALAGLDAAVAGQRAAVAAWRGALAELGTAMAGLGRSMQHYQGSLDTLGGRVARLHVEAVQLERTADAVLVARPD